jgi:diaminohydroxyphosphoribosylaminopyrimidine deaminase / 5-amino-6-(5-phosphoribosylamino)uracil reductase
VQTASVDDPRLTTRLVPGLRPVRVVLDPHARLAPHLQVLRDGAAPTVVVTGKDGHAEPERWGAHVQVLHITCHDGLLDPRDILDALHARGLSRVFVEGGGVTVSRFLQAHALDRLHVTVAPKIIGSGTPALQLAPIDRIADAITAVRCRRFTLGTDVLFDCDLRAGRP